LRRLWCWLCCFILLTVHSVCFAAPVDIDKAGIVARNWLAQKTGVSDPSFLKISLLSPSRQSSAAGTYYIFNQPSGGWVIVAADDVAYPVIAYSPDGRIDLQNPPPAYTAWMEQVAAQIQAVVNQPPQQSRSVDPVSVEIETAWAKWAAPNYLPQEQEDVALRSDTGIRSAVSPLLQTTWDQDQYYNAKCPFDSAGPDGHVWAGCVATAMGQIMKYHNWPPTGVGSHGYYSDYGWLSVDFSSTTYNWTSMPASGQLTYYNNAVSTLLYHVGVAVDMDYDGDGSAASSSDVVLALQNYFRYETSGYVVKDSDLSVWLSKLKTDLNAGRPIYYRGQGDDGAHAFVCDGYDANYFHFNWGWNGRYDAYFYLNDLTPDDHDFTDWQGAVMGIRPARPDLVPYEPANWNDTIPVSTVQHGGNEDHYEIGPYYDYQSLYINYACSNDGDKDAGHFTIMIEVTGEGGEILNFSKNSLASGYYTYNSTDIAIGPLTAGIHTIKLWVDYNDDVDESDENNNYYERTITILPPPQPDLTPYKPYKWNEELPVGTTQRNGDDYHNETGPYYDNQTLYINYACGNDGDKDAGHFTIMIEVTGEGGEILNFSKNSLASGYYTYNSTDIAIGPLTAGIHTIKLWVDYDGYVDESNEANNYYERTITVLSPPQPDLIPYQPTNWNDKIPVSTITHSWSDDVRSETGPYFNDQMLYIDCSCLNAGNKSAGSFKIMIEISGDGGGTFTRSHWSLSAGAHTELTDISIGSLSEGIHLIKIWMDSDNEVDESDETNNFYQRTLVVCESSSDLTPYQLTNWNDKIPISRTQLDGAADHYETGPYYDDQALYMNFATFNQGNVDAGAYSIKFEVTGQGGEVWNDTMSASEAGYYYYYSNDRSIGPLSSGYHIIKFWLDFDNEISECNDSNNYYERTFLIYSRSDTCTWHGMNSNWEDTANWDVGYPPFSRDIAIIAGSVATADPVIDAGTATAKKLIIQSRSLIIENGGSLTIGAE